VSRYMEAVENPDVMNKRSVGGRFIVPIADLSAYARCVHILISTKI